MDTVQAPLPSVPARHAARVARPGAAANIDHAGVSSAFGPSLHRHYPASSLLRPLLTPPRLSPQRSPRARTSTPPARAAKLYPMRSSMEFGLSRSQQTRPRTRPHCSFVFLRSCVRLPLLPARPSRFAPCGSASVGSIASGGYLVLLRVNAHAGHTGSERSSRRRHTNLAASHHRCSRERRSLPQRAARPLSILHGALLWERATLATATSTPGEGTDRRGHEVSMPMPGSLGARRARDGFPDSARRSAAPSRARGALQHGAR